MGVGVSGSRHWGCERKLAARPALFGLPVSFWRNEENLWGCVHFHGAITKVRISCSGGKPAVRRIHVSTLF